MPSSWRPPPAILGRVGGCAAPQTPAPTGSALRRPLRNALRGVLGAPSARGSGHRRLAVGRDCPPYSRMRVYGKSAAVRRYLAIICHYCCRGASLGSFGGQAFFSAASYRSQPRVTSFPCVILPFKGQGRAVVTTCAPSAAPCVCAGVRVPALSAGVRAPRFSGVVSSLGLVVAVTACARAGCGGLVLAGSVGLGALTRPSISVCPLGCALFLLGACRPCAPLRVACRPAPLHPLGGGSAAAVFFMVLLGSRPLNKPK